MFKSLTLALAVALCGSAPALAADVTSGTKDAEAAVLNFDRSTKKPSPYWSNAVAGFEAVETTAPRGATVLFGDSITARWPMDKFPANPVVNRGIGGDHIGGYKYFGLLDRMNTSIRALQPKRIFLMIGINDMLPQGPPMENMVAAYGYLLDHLKQDAPDAEVIVQSILPVNKPDFSYMHDPIIELNKHIKQMADERGLKYVDLYSHFADEKGEMKPELTNDGVHLTPAGYELWVKVLTDEGLVAHDAATTATAAGK